MLRKITIYSLLLIFSLIAYQQQGYAQTYSPSVHTVVSKPLGLNGLTADARSYYYDATHFVYRPYQSTAEVLTYLSTTKNRQGNFPIYVNPTGTINSSTGVMTGGSVLEYWFKDGTADANLVQKASGGSSNTFLTPLAVDGSGNVSIQQSSDLQAGYLSAADHAAFNGKQNALTLTTTGSSGAATLTGSTLNIPQYAGQTYTANNGVTLAGSTFSADTGYVRTTANSFSKAEVNTQIANKVSSYVPYSGATTNVDLGTHEYFGGAGEFGGTWPGAGAGGFYNNSATGRAAYLIGGSVGHPNTDIYDYNNNIISHILGTKTYTTADSLALTTKKYVDGVVGSGSSVNSITLNTSGNIHATPITFSKDASNNWTGTMTLNSQTAKTVFAAPSGGNGTPSFRQLGMSDLSDGSSYQTAATADSKYGTLSQQNLNTTAINNNYTAIGLKQPRILGSKPSATSTTYAATDSVSQALSNHDAAINASYLGTIISDNFSNLSAWTNNGTPGASVTGNALSFSGNATLKDYIYNSGYGVSNLEYPEVNFDLNAGTVNTTSGGPFATFQSYSPNPGVNYYGVQVYFNLTTSGAGIVTVYWANSTTGGVALTNKFTVGSNDNLHVKISYVVNKLIVTVHNITQNKDWSGSYVIPTSYPNGTILQPNGFQYGLGSLGGNFTISNYSVKSYDRKNLDMLFVGNSIAKGYYTTNSYNRFANIFGRYYNIQVGANCGPGNKIENINTNEPITLAPKNITIELGTNNVSSGDNTTTFQSKLTTLVNSFTSAGYVLGSNLFIETLLPRNSNDVTPYNSVINSLYASSGAVIDLYSAFLGSGTGINGIYSPDGLHPNDAGHQLYADVLINFFKGKFSRQGNPLVDYSPALLNNNYLALGNGNISQRAQYPLDINDISNSSLAHFGNTANGNVGGFVASRASSDLELMGGLDLQNNNYVARSTNTSVITIGSGQIGFYNNPNTTVGNNVSPTLSGIIDTDHSFNLYQPTGASNNSQFKLGSGYNSTFSSISSGANGSIIWAAGGYIANNAWKATNTTFSYFNTNSTNMNLGFTTGLTLGSTFTPLSNISFSSTGIRVLNAGITSTVSPAGAFMDLDASTTSEASLRVRSGVRPTTTNDGDIYNDLASHHLFTNLNGTWYQLDQQGYVIPNRTAVADADYTALTTDYIISYTSMTTAHTITLVALTGATATNPQPVIIKDESGLAGTNNITIAAPSGKTIDGASSVVINTAYGFKKLYYNGTNFFTY